VNTVLITGGAGFIGSSFVRYILEKTQFRALVLDKLTYAGSLLNLKDVENHARFDFIHGDIANEALVASLFEKKRPLWVVNFAAETHVDRSIDDPSSFIQTNVVGVYVLLQTALNYYRHLSEKERQAFRFLHVSTDEVYGSLGADGYFSEDTPYQPNSPYSASKAGADHLVQAYFATYGLPVLITNCSNNYGPRQFPEKLIPLMILNAVEGKDLPIYGDGLNIRDWLHVKDHCSGIYLALEKGKTGEKYNIGGGNERTNIQVIDVLCQTLEKMRAAHQNTALQSKGIQRYENLKKFVKDRLGHDRRYAINSNKIRQQLGWKPEYDFESGMKETIRWYLENMDWCREIQKNNYSRERLGLKTAK